MVRSAPPISSYHVKVRPLSGSAEADRLEPAGQALGREGLRLLLEEPKSSQSSSLSAR